MLIVIGCGCLIIGVGVGILFTADKKTHRKEGS